MNTDTTVGKTVRTLVWVVISGAVMAAVSYITGHKEYFSPYTVTLANVILVAGKNFLDPQVKNI